MVRGGRWWGCVRGVEEVCGDEVVYWGGDLLVGGGVVGFLRFFGEEGEYKDFIGRWFEGDFSWVDGFLC